MRIKALRLMLTDLAKQLGEGLIFALSIVILLGPVVAATHHSPYWWWVYPGAILPIMLLYWYANATDRLDKHND